MPTSCTGIKVCCRGWPTVVISRKTFRRIVWWMRGRRTRTKCGNPNCLQVKFRKTSVANMNHDKNKFAVETRFKHPAPHASGSPVLNCCQESRYVKLCLLVCQQMAELGRRLAEARPEQWEIIMTDVNNSDMFRKSPFAFGSYHVCYSENVLRQQATIIMNL